MHTITLTTKTYGTDFNFKFKWLEKAKQLIKSATKDQPAQSKSAQFPILIAEDNLIAQKIHTMMLEKLGYEVHIAEDGCEAVQLYKQNIYTAVFVDIHMPIMNGIDTIHYMRAICEQTPIIALSVDRDEETVQTCFTLGAKEFATKPMSVDKFDEIITKYNPSE